MSIFEWMTDSGLCCRMQFSDFSTFKQRKKWASLLAVPCEAFYGPDGKRSGVVTLASSRVDHFTKSNSSACPRISHRGELNQHRDAEGGTWMKTKALRLSRIRSERLKSGLNYFVLENSRRRQLRRPQGNDAFGKLLTGHSTRFSKTKRAPGAECITAIYYSGCRGGPSHLHDLFVLLMRFLVLQDHAWQFCRILTTALFAVLVNWSLYRPNLRVWLLYRPDGQLRIQLHS